MATQQRILVVSHDSRLADVRKALLDASGFQVFAARNMNEVREACQKRPQLVMIGYSLPPAAKRQVWAAVRERCNVPILELHKNEQPSLAADVFFHRPKRPDDFLAVVRRILAEAEGDLHRLKGQKERQMTIQSQNLTDPAKARKVSRAQS